MNETPETPVSKTRRKKDMHALQALGEALIELTATQLSALQLPERLADAIEEAKRIPGFEARRRQMQYIGRLMRDIDASAIAAYLERLSHDRHRGNSHHLELERWRNRLLAEDQALTELAEASPGLDMRQLRTLIRNARNEQARNQPPRASRALFRLLREILPESAAGTAAGHAASEDPAVEP